MHTDDTTDIVADNARAVGSSSPSGRDASDHASIVKATDGMGAFEQRLEQGLGQAQRDPREEDFRAWKTRLGAAMKGNDRGQGIAANVTRYLDFVGHGDNYTYELSSFGVTNKEVIKQAGGWGTDAKLVAYVTGRAGVARFAQVASAGAQAHKGEALYLVSGVTLPTLALRYTSKEAWHKVTQRCQAADILERRVLPFDLDPERQPKDRSATNDEHILALGAGKLFSCYLWECLDRLGKSRTCLAYGPSGNGFHCLLAVAIPEAPEVTTVYEQILAAMDRRVKSWGVVGVGVDPTLINPDRLLPIYGTKKCKGGEGPTLKIKHRWSCLVADKPMERLSLDDLRALLALVVEGLPAEPAAQPVAPSSVAPTAPKANGKKAKRSAESEAAWRDFREQLFGISLDAGMRFLGLMDGDKPICPGHGEAAKGSDIAIIPTRNGQGYVLNCQHRRCHGKGDCKNTKGTNWTLIGVVMEQRKCDRKTAQDILAEAFHIEKPQGRAPRRGADKTAAQLLVRLGEDPNIAAPNFQAVRRAVQRLALAETEIIQLGKLLKAKKWQDRQVELLLGQGVLEQITPEVGDLAAALDQQRQPLLTQLLCFADPAVKSAGEEVANRFKTTMELVDLVPILSSEAACKVLAQKIHGFVECGEDGELLYPFSSDSVDPESLMEKAALSWPMVKVAGTDVSTKDVVVRELKSRQKLTGLARALSTMKAPNTSHVKTALMFMEANDRIKYDRFAQEPTYIVNDKAWGVRAGQVIEDAHDVILQTEIQEFLQTSVGIESARGGIKAFTRAYSYDSAQDWLNSLPAWDQVSRLDEFMTLCRMRLGPMQRKMVYYWTTQLVRRIQCDEEPAKADYLLVLIGGQGASKSTIFEYMGLNKWTYMMQLSDLKGDRNTLARKLQGKLFVNIDELAGGSAADRETVKSFITSVREEYNVKWQRAIERSLRRFVLGGTSNMEDILKDPTGDRRYFCVEVGTSTDAELEAMRKRLVALWSLVVAEVRDQLAAGGRYYPTRGEEELFVQYHEAMGFRHESVVDQRVARHLDVLRSNGVTAARMWEVWTLTKIPTEHMLADDFGREYENPGYREYNSFCANKAQEHKIAEAIRKAKLPPKTPVRREDKSRETHIVLDAPSRTLPHSTEPVHRTLDQTGDLALSGKRLSPDQVAEYLGEDNGGRGRAAELSSASHTVTPAIQVASLACEKDPEQDVTAGSDAEPSSLVNASNVLERASIAISRVPRGNAAEKTPAGTETPIGLRVAGCFEGAWEIRIVRTQGNYSARGMWTFLRPHGGIQHIDGPILSVDATPEGVAALQLALRSRMDEGELPDFARGTEWKLTPGIDEAMASL